MLLKCKDVSLQTQLQKGLARYFIEIAYDGTPYHGWQKQPNATSVQQNLEEALSTLLRKNIEVVGAGRTDAGVHAKQLYAHFDLDQKLEGITLDQLTFRLNRFLEKTIAVERVIPVGDDAHARFDAVARSYLYKITKNKDPFSINTAWLVEQHLDVKRMNTAADFLLGQQDFKCFSRSKTDVKTYLCDISQAYFRENEKEISFYISADRFLRNMVRAIVGTLIEIGLHNKPISYLEEVLASRDRSKAGASAPAHGLYLIEVKYPDTILI